MGGGQLRGVDQADPSGAEAGDDVDQYLDPVRLDARQLGGLLIAAHGQYVPADVGALEQHRRQYGQHREHVHARGHVQPVGAQRLQAHVAQALVAGDLGKRSAVGAQVRKATADVHGAQGGDEGRHIQLGDDQAVNQADQAAHQQHQHDDGGHGEVNGLAADGQALLDQAAGQHARQAHHRAHGKVDAAGDDDERHAQGEYAIQRHVLGDHRQRAGLQEGGRGKAEEDDQ